MEPRPQNARPRPSPDRSTRPLSPQMAPGPGAAAPPPVPPPHQGDDPYGAARPEPPRYGPDPYAAPPPATPEGAYPAYSMNEPVPRRGAARRALLRGGLVLLVLVAIGAALAAAINGDLIGGGDDAVSTPTPVGPGGAPAIAASPVTTPRAAAAAPRATATPRPSPTLSTTETEAAPASTRAARRPTRTPTGPPVAEGDLAALLPSSDQIPGSLPEQTTAERGADDVAASFGDDAETAATRLDDWGWSQNIYRDFQADDATANPESVSTVNVSLHQFDSDESAAEALAYFSDAAAAGGLSDAEIDPIGDGSRALIGGDTGSNLAAVYVQKGSVLIRIGTFSTAGDALPAAVEVATTVATT
jgi:hypothetical protein